MKYRTLKEWSYLPKKRPEKNKHYKPGDEFVHPDSAVFPVKCDLTWLIEENVIERMEA